MPHLSPPLSILTAATIACSAAIAAPVSAANFSRIETAMSAETCQAALPAFDGSIRKRPMAMMNEGAQHSIVTCAFSGVNDSTPATLGIQVYLVNSDTVSHTVTCTFIDGRAGFTNPLYVPRALAVAPGSEPQAILWTIGDSAETMVAGFVYPALSCDLAPKTGIRFTRRFYYEKY